MPITEAFSASGAITTTEQSLTTNTAGPDTETSDGVYQLWLDVNDMVGGDELQIRGYEQVQTSGTQRIFLQSTLIGPQSPPIYVTPAFILMHGWDFTLDTIAGTSINVIWSIRKVG